MPDWLAQLLLLVLFVFCVAATVGMVFGQPTGQGRRPDDDLDGMA